MKYLEPIPIKIGGPGTAQSVAKTALQRGWQWQYRTAMAFREYPDHHPYWCTFTYAEEPDTWDTASHHIEKHLKRLNRFKTDCQADVVQGF